MFIYFLLLLGLVSMGFCYYKEREMRKKKGIKMEYWNDEGLFFLVSPDRTYRVSVLMKDKAVGLITYHMQGDDTIKTEEVWHLIKEPLVS